MSGQAGITVEVNQAEVTLTSSITTTATNNTGALRNSEFVVPVRILVTEPVAPRSIRLRLHRASTGETLHLTARPSTARTIAQSTMESRATQRAGRLYSADWTVTRRSGAWDIAVHSYELPDGSVAAAPRSVRPCRFQIDKREQIVTLARQWSQRGLADANQSPRFNGCDGFVTYIYTHLGLPEPSLSALTPPTVPDTGKGSIYYLFEPNGEAYTTGAHVGIVSSPGWMIDCNWGSSGVGPRERRIGGDLLQFYYAPDGAAYSPRDPTHPGHSLLDLA